MPSLSSEISNPTRQCSVWHDHMAPICALEQEVDCSPSGVSPGYLCSRWKFATCGKSPEIMSEMHIIYEDKLHLFAFLHSFLNRKNKNDISKLIFKSGDFQMSPYAEYPKNPRAQEWGRETIEMQENGSTKNLLQMTDVYYSVSIHSLTINPLYLIQQRYIPLFWESQIPFLQNKKAKQMASIDSKALGVRWTPAITCVLNTTRSCH